MGPGQPPLEDAGYLKRAQLLLTRLGFKVMLGRSVGEAKGHLREELAAEDFHNFVLDSRVKALIALRGGYGSLRLLPHLDLSLLRNRPKIFIGYSDVTALLLALYKTLGLVTFHGPMVCPELGAPQLPLYTEKGFFQASSCNAPLGTLFPPPELPPPPICLHPGEAKGPRWEATCPWWWPP